MTANAEMQDKIRRMAEIKREQEALKAEWSQLEAYFLKRCQEDLEDTKRKTVSYIGAGGKVTATVAETVKVTWPSYFRQIFGDAYQDAVTEEVKYKLSASASRMLAGIWTKGYSRETVAEVIAQLPCDEKTRQTLAKKLKGANYETDKKNLIAIGGLDEETAAQSAYFIAEAAVWESFCRLMKVNRKEDPAAMDEVMHLIDGAIVVEETPKVAFEILDGAEDA